MTGSPKKAYLDSSGQALAETRVSRLPLLDGPPTPACSLGWGGPGAGVLAQIALPANTEWVRRPPPSPPAGSRGPRASRLGRRG